jgi:hypothetical protein
MQTSNNAKQFLINFFLRMKGWGVLKGLDIGSGETKLFSGKTTAHPLTR